LVSGPVLQEIRNCGASPGFYSKNATLQGNCVKQFNFHRGGGLKIEEPNQTYYTYSLSIWCSFNFLENFTQLWKTGVIGSTNSTIYPHAGVYLKTDSSGTQLFVNPYGSIGPPNSFFPETMYLFTFVRYGNSFTVYVDGILFATFVDSLFLLYGEMGSPFTFFYIQEAEFCEERKSGAVQFIELSNYRLTSEEVRRLFVEIKTQESNIETNEFLCIGDSMVLKANTTGSAIGSFLWSTGSTSNSIQIKPNRDSTYQCTYSYDACLKIHSIFNLKIQHSKPSLVIPLINICKGSIDTLSAKPSIAGGDFLWSNGETGSSILVSDSVTTSYTCTYDLGYCSADTVGIVQVAPLQFPHFEPIGPLCSDATVPLLPSNTKDSIFGTWIPPTINNLSSDTYLFEPLEGQQCVRSTAMTVIVHEKTISIFDSVGAICSGSELAPLPIFSTNDISGKWDPEIDNTTSKEYTFTPDSGQCATTAMLTIVVNEMKLPSFTPVNAICSGEELTTLPLLSTNAVSGRWNPQINNTATTEYTFTPDSGQCAVTTNMIVSVKENKLPSFAAVDALCSGENIAPLPLLSNNGIHGSWAPPIHNTTTTYTFNPDSGQCVLPEMTTLIITVNEIINPTFTPVETICAGDLLAPLPTTSNNEIRGSWAPPINNSSSTLYIFTPDSGQCATTANLTIVVKENKLPSFTAIDTLCSGENIAPLPLLSNNGVHGSWTPPINNTATTTYTFSPDSGQCILPESTILLITVNEKINPTFSPVETICMGDPLSPLPTLSNNEINGSWAPPMNNSSTTLYTFTPDSAYCANTSSMIIQVDSILVPLFNFKTNFCAGSLITPLPLMSTNTIHGNWQPALNNKTSTLYTFTPDSGVCAVGISEEIIIHPLPQASFNFSPSYITIPQPILSFTNTSTGASDFQWIFNDSYSTPEPNPSFQFSSHTKDQQLAQLIAITAFGCMDTVKVIIEKEIHYYVPNSFTPDNNLFNEVFQPFFPPENQPSQFSFLILNRWGQIAYTTNNPKDGWNGDDYRTQENCPDGIYTWILEFEDPNTGDLVKKIGAVNLIR
jgi:hypothetical protein